MVFYPRVWSVVVVSLGCWILAVLLVDFCFVPVRVGEESLAVIGGAITVFFAGLGLYCLGLRLVVDLDGAVRYDTFYFFIVFWPVEVKQEADSWVLRFDRGTRRGGRIRAKHGHLGELAFLVRNILQPDEIAIDPYLWRTEERPELLAVLTELRKGVREGRPRSSAARLQVLSRITASTSVTGWIRGGVRSFRAWWASRTSLEVVEFHGEKALSGLEWVVRKSFEGMVWLVSLLIGWREVERGWDLLQPRPIVFRPSMAALVVFWLFFGYIEYVSVLAFLSAWSEGNDVSRLTYGVFSVGWLAMPLWESSKRLAIRLDARFVYDTFLYSITFLPTHVRVKRKGEEWVLVFNPKAVDLQGGPSVEFRPKWKWIGKAAIAVRKEFVENEIEFSSGVWNLEKQSFMLAVFEKLRRAVKEGKQVKLW